MSIATEEKSVDEGIVLKELDDLRFEGQNQTILVALILRKTSIFGSDIEQVLDDIEKSKKFSPDLIIAPEYSFCKRDPLTLSELLTYQRMIELLSEGTTIIPGTFLWTDDQFLFHSTTVFSGKRAIFEYYKMNDGGEVNYAGKLGLKPYFGKIPGVFQMNGLRAGIEICADYGFLYLFGRDNLDLHIIVSSGLQRRYSVPVKQGGYGIIVDGAVPSHRILRNEVINNPYFSQIKTFFEEKIEILKT